MLRRRSGARFPFLRRRISPSPTRHRNPDRPRPERAGPGIRLRADRDAGLELRLGRRGGPRLGLRPDGPAGPGVRRGSDPAGRRALLSDLHERHGPIHPNGLPEGVPPRLEESPPTSKSPRRRHLRRRSDVRPGPANAYIAPQGPLLEPARRPFREPLAGDRAIRISVPAVKRGAKITSLDSRPSPRPSSFWGSLRPKARAMPGRYSRNSSGTFILHGGGSNMNKSRSVRRWLRAVLFRGREGALSRSFFRLPRLMIRSPSIGSGWHRSCCDLGGYKRVQGVGHESPA